MIRTIQIGLSILLVVSVLCGSKLWSQDSKPESADADPGMKAWYAFYQREAENTYRFKLGEQGLELDRTPILRWTNPLEEGSIHGVVYIWRQKGRPVVVGQLFSYLNGKGGRVYCHAMHSLARDGETVIGLRDGTVFWTPDSPGVEMHDVPDAPPPAANRRLRLVQMKAISRRFSAFTEEATRGKRVLRLLPTPLDRHPEPATDDVDSAMFSFVVGNDPEVMLLVETRKSSTDVPVWKYGLCRSTRSTCVAMLDDRETWRYDSDSKPTNQRSGYLSVHGIATLPLEPPDIDP